MPATPSDLFAFLDRLGIAHATVTHPALFTVEQSRELRGTIPGGHTKNLFLKDKKGALFLVTALEDAVIELKSLHRRLAASGRFSFGPADLMRATLGIEPGAVTPLAAMNDSERRVSGPGAIPRSHRPSAPDRGTIAFSGETPSWTRSARKQLRRRKRVKPDTAGTGSAGAALSLSIANTPADTI